MEVGRTVCRSARKQWGCHGMRVALSGNQRACPPLCAAARQQKTAKQGQAPLHHGPGSQEGTASARMLARPSGATWSAGWRTWRKSRKLWKAERIRGKKK